VTTLRGAGTASACGALAGAGGGVVDAPRVAFALSCDAGGGPFTEGQCVDQRRPEGTTLLDVGRRRGREQVLEQRDRRTRLDQHRGLDRRSLAAPQARPRTRERPFGDCLGARQIAEVQTAGAIAPLRAALALLRARTLVAQGQIHA